MPKAHFGHHDGTSRSLTSASFRGILVASQVGTRPEKAASLCFCTERGGFFHVTRKEGGETYVETASSAGAADHALLVRGRHDLRRDCIHTARHGGQRL